MKVAIAGGHGQVARRLTRLLVRDHDVLAVIRNPDHAADVQEDGATAIVIDLETVDADAVAAAIDGAEAVVFAAGAGPGGDARREAVDFGGAVKLIAAARSVGAGHYVMISGLGVDPEAGDGPMAGYFRAKGKADEALRESGVPYTIVQPCHMINEAGSGRVRAAAPRELEDLDISRDDVARVLAAVLERGPMDLTFELVSGELQIEDALDALSASSNP
jgi:uncharacterized protein YbjT (DUF2867 family)